MNQWVDQSIMQELENCFGRLIKANGWQVLINTIYLYRKIALETASILKFEYDGTLDKRVSTFIEELKNR